MAYEYQKSTQKKELWKQEKKHKTILKNYIKFPSGHPVLIGLSLAIHSYRYTYHPNAAVK